MKKILSVLVVAMLCVCMMAPSVAAASVADIETVLSDIDTIDLSDLTGMLEDYNSQPTEEDELESAIVGGLSSLFGFDVSAFVSEDADAAAFDELFSGFDASNLSSVLGLVSETMSGAGIDLSAFTAGSEGGFDITSVLSSSAVLAGGETGTQDLAVTVTNMTAGLAETLKSGLTALGLDTATIEGILDNEIVNFFANMYIGFIGEVEEETTTKAEETTTKETTTKKPAVVTTETPKTGDTSSVVVAVATLALASSAALVCLKKKED